MILKRDLFKKHIIQCWGRTAPPPSISDSDSNHASNTTTPQLHSQESNVVIEDKGEELRTKLTFSSPHQKRVKDKIKMFELTPSVGGGVCL